MVQKFKPTPYMAYYNSYAFSIEGYPQVKMEHSRYGDWVRLETYQDAIRQRDKQIAKLKKKLLEK